MADRRSSHHERAVGDGLGDSSVLFGAGQYGRSDDSGTSALKCHIVRVHHSQMLKSKVAHCPSGGTDVERVARVHQDNAQMVEFSRNRQAVLFYGSLRGSGLPAVRLATGAESQSTPYAATVITPGVQM